MKSIAANKILYNHISDGELWQDFKNGDKQAFAFLYHRYCNILLQNALGICNDKEMVKDCIHDLFMTIWKNRQRLNIPRSVKAYLLRSVQRKIIRQLKKSRSHFVAYAAQYMEADVVHSIEKKIIADQLYQRQKQYIIKAIEALSRRQKEAVYLKFYANLSYPEIAGKMAISTDAIYNLISKAIDNMQGRLSRNLLYLS
ncbi:MAG: sigma-70 family RNA polymerase sigma factor [Chitinophagaceae bacterium]|nr:sigma-70 family RNA polymerase sigma factor [Chitinophagaceae bacterium]